MRVQEIDELIIRCIDVAVHFCVIVVVFVDVYTQCIDIFNISSEIPE